MAIDHRSLLRPSEPPPSPGAAAISDPFELWQLAVLAPAEFAALGLADGNLSQAQLRYLAAYDLLAPSSHNTVPQRFVFPAAGNEIEIWLDRQAVLTASDPSGRQASISLGCGIANLLHAARRYGFEADVETYDAPASPLPAEREGPTRYSRVARLRFRRGGALGPEACLHAMLQRRMVRADYNASVALPIDLGQQLKGLVSAQYPELEFHLLSDASTLGFLGDLQELADSTALSREDFTAELGRWLIENDSDSPLGMRGREHGLSDALTLSVQSRLLSDAGLASDDVTVLARSGNIGIRSSSAVGVICVAEDSLHACVRAGRALEDLLLLLHQHGFVTAMHASIAEIESANLALQARLGTRARPIVVFRMGQALEQSDSRRPHSARPSVQDVTLPESFVSLPSERAVS